MSGYVPFFGKLLLIFNVVFDHFLVLSNGRDEIATGSEIFSAKIPLASSEISSDRDRAFPVDIVNHVSHRIYIGAVWILTICT